MEEKMTTGKWIKLGILGLLFYWVYKVLKGMCEFIGLPVKLVVQWLRFLIIISFIVYVAWPITWKVVGPPLKVVGHKIEEGCSCNTTEAHRQ